MDISIGPARRSTNSMNKFTSIEPAQISTFLIAIPLICPTRRVALLERIERVGGARQGSAYAYTYIHTFANILIVMTVVPGPLSMTRRDFIDVLTLPPFHRAADCRVNRTVKIGYDVCSASYRGCSRQPIRVILRESSYAKSRCSVKRRPHLRSQIAFFFFFFFLRSYGKM